MGKLIDLTGHKYGELTVIERSPIKSKGGTAVWLCECSCGNYKEVWSQSLRSGNTSSCGCRGLKEGEAALSRVLQSYKASAGKRDYSWELTDEEATVKFRSNCYYCGSSRKSTWVTENGDTYKYMGIDREDNSLGYLNTNTVPCCKVCNTAKLTMSREDYVNHCIKVADKWRKR